MMEESRKIEIEKLAGETFGIHPRTQWWARNSESDGIYITFDSKREADRWWDDYGDYNIFENAEIVERNIYPKFLRSLDAAMLLTREGWTWGMKQTYAYAYVDVFENNGARLLAEVHEPLSFYPSVTEAMATCRTLCALKAAGVDVEILGRDADV